MYQSLKIEKDKSIIIKEACKDHSLADIILR